MMISIDQELAEEIVLGYEGYVATQDVSEHRWYTKQMIVYEKDGQLLGFYYLNPSSELQEDQERFESDPVRVFPVEGKPVTTTMYHPVS
jgi:hypothetical protein